MINRNTFILIVPIILLIFSISSAQAHKVRIFAWEEGGQIKTEAKFSGSKPARNSTITVTARDSGEEILKGKTDEKGIFSFPVPQKAKDNLLNLKITVDSGDGHKNSWLLNAEDYLPGIKQTPERGSTIITEMIPAQKNTTIKKSQ
jgi:nickel transport protein